MNRSTRLLISLALGAFAILGLLMGPQPRATALDQLFLEAPRVMDQGHQRFPELLSAGGRVWLFSQKVVEEGSDGGVLVIEARSSTDGRQWSAPFNASPTVPYQGATIPRVYHLQQDGNLVFMSFSQSASATTLAYLDLGQENPQARTLGSVEDQSGFAVVNPRIFRRSDGSFFFLAERNDGNGLNIVHASSEDGVRWPQPRVLETALAAAVNINPGYADYRGLDWVVFQSLDINRNRTAPTNQLFLRTSSDRGATWSEPRELTAFADPGSTQDFLRWDNQRPVLQVMGDRLLVLWERGLRNNLPQAALATLDRNGIQAASFVYATSIPGGAYNLRLLDVDGSPGVISFSSSRTVGRTWLSRLEDGRWSGINLSGDAGITGFPTAVIHQGRLHAAWHFRADPNAFRTRLVYLEPDQSAEAPRIFLGAVPPGGRTGQQDQRFTLRPAPDVSGTRGFSWVLGQDPDAPVPRVQNLSADQELGSLVTPRDGPWYLRVRTLDRAGNWSEPATFAFTVDTTPPVAPRLSPLAVDPAGAALSNTFEQTWDQDLEDDRLSYEYAFSYLGDAAGFDPSTLSLPSAASLSRTLTGTRSFSRINVENGWYLIQVWTLDSVGNRSEPAWAYQRFVRFRPSTLISRLDLTEDDLGNRFLTIIGRGYQAEGRVQRIYLDRDKLEPWDLEYRLEDGTYRLVGDRRIEGLAFSRVPQGQYWLGLDHSGRGRTWATQLLSFPGQGAVKYGDFTLVPPRIMASPSRASYRITGTSLALWALVALIALSIPLWIRKLRVLAGEMRSLEVLAQALATGRSLSQFRRMQEVKKMRSNQGKLGLKFTFFFLILVIAVVALVAIPLSDYTLRNQRSVLARGLDERVQVIMESLVSGASGFLSSPDDFFIELQNLTTQSVALPEAQYVTITGRGSPGTEGYDILWGSSDPEINRDVDDPSTLDPDLVALHPVLSRKASELPYVNGRSTITDAVAPLVPDLEVEINRRAREFLGDLPAQLEAYRQESGTLIRNNSAESIRRRTEIDRETRAINARITEILRSLSPRAQSIPAFDPENYDASQEFHIFYRPVLFRSTQDQGTEARYYRGMVRLGISTESITAAIDATQDTIIRNILIFAGIALAGGLVGALALSSIINIPIQKLVKGVRHIQDTDDKETLEDYSVGIRTRDELEDLGAVIDSMAHSLAKAAAASKDLQVGKDVQKKFIPLDQVGKEKGTTGTSVTDDMEIFGYYDGAKGVSGDYFSYLELGQGWYALIKCDISGKGVPAALIMVQVATLFLDYFKDWEKKKVEKIKIQRAMGVKNPQVNPDLGSLILKINDAVADMEYVGRFAAFNITLLHEETGDLVFCNAGDTKVQIYRAASREVEVVNLFNAPAAGMFSSKIMPISFQEDENRLAPGDLLILVTDGLEESKYTHLDDQWEPSPLSQEDLDAGLFSDPKQLDDQAEELGPERVIAIFKAAINRQSFEVRHQKGAPARTPLVMDYSSLPDTLADKILAVMATEKVFRLVLHPDCGPNDIIQVDKKIVPYLEKCFVQFRQVFAHPLPDDPESLYTRYSHIRENIQYDDLTLLAVLKK